VRPSRKKRTPPPEEEGKEGFPFRAKTNDGSLKQQKGKRCSSSLLFGRKGGKGRCIAINVHGCAQWKKKKGGHERAARKKGGGNNFFSTSGERGKEAVRTQSSEEKKGGRIHFKETRRGGHQQQTHWGKRNESPSGEGKKNPFPLVEGGKLFFKGKKGD